MNCRRSSGLESSSLRVICAMSRSNSSTLRRNVRGVNGRLGTSAAGSHIFGSVLLKHAVVVPNQCRYHYIIAPSDSDRWREVLVPVCFDNRKNSFECTLIIMFQIGLDAKMLALASASASSFWYRLRTLIAFSYGTFWRRQTEHTCPLQCCTRMSVFCLKCNSNTQWRTDVDFSIISRTVSFRNACNIIRELMALTSVPCFYSIYFHC